MAREGIEAGRIERRFLPWRIERDRGVILGREGEGVDRLTVAEWVTREWQGHAGYAGWRRGDGWSRDRDFVLSVTEEVNLVGVWKRLSVRAREAGVGGAIVRRDLSGSRQCGVSWCGCDSEHGQSMMVWDEVGWSIIRSLLVVGGNSDTSLTVLARELGFCGRVLGLSEIDSHQLLRRLDGGWYMNTRVEVG